MGERPTFRLEGDVMAESRNGQILGALAAALALAGCGAREAAPAPAPAPATVVGEPAEVPKAPAPMPAPIAPPVPMPPAAPALSRLAGDWVLLTIDGSPPDRNAHYVHMRFDEPGRIAANSQCIPFRWRYRDDQGRLVIENERYPGPVCARPLSMWERRFQEAMNAATRIRIDEHGLLVVTGTGGTLRFQRE
jgi:heat shock protein HslJ